MISLATLATPLSISFNCSPEGGCIGKSGKPIPVGGWEKDPNTCGVYVCQNNEGVALIHYCQSPPPFQECDDDGVSTVLPFPECCWICVDYADESTQKSVDESTQKSGDNSQQRSGEESKGSEEAATDGTGGENKEKSNVANANKSKRKINLKYTS